MPAYPHKFATVVLALVMSTACSASLAQPAADEPSGLPRLQREQAGQNQDYGDHPRAAPQLVVHQDPPVVGSRPRTMSIGRLLPGAIR